MVLGAGFRVLLGLRAQDLESYLGFGMRVSGQVRNLGTW